MSLLVTPARSDINVPKYVDDRFVLRNNYYVVTNGTIFNSYPLKVFSSNDTDLIIRMERNPPTLLEGYAIVGRKVYQVSYQDLLRKIIRKSKEVKPEISDEPNTNTRTSPLATIVSSDRDGTLSDLFEPGALAAAELEISKAADLAWEEQVGSLFNPSFEEEEWEIEDAA